MKWLKYIIVYSLTMLLLSAVYSVPVYFLWNWLMPFILKLPVISLTQAWGVSLFFQVLFDLIRRLVRKIIWGKESGGVGAKKDGPTPVSVGAHAGLD